VADPTGACQRNLAAVRVRGWDHRQARLIGRERLCPADSLNYSTNRANLGHLRGERYGAAMGDVYAACFKALRPGGLLVTVTKNTRRSGHC
jgi:hypothetical protein